MKITLDPRISKADIEKVIKEPLSIYLNDISDVTASIFAVQVEMAQSIGQEILPVYINTYGGHLYAALHIVNIMKNSGLIIATVNCGAAFSAGAIILAHGTYGYRYAAPNSDTMLHHVISQSEGSSEDMIMDAQQADRSNRKLYKDLAKYTDKEADYYYSLLKNNGDHDMYLTPKQAKEHGLVDKIKYPSFEMNVEINYKVK